MSHRIIEVQPWDNRRTEIATAENYANAYTIAKAMSGTFHEVIYEAVNGNIERTITYRAGELVSDTHDTTIGTREEKIPEHVEIPRSSPAGLQAVKYRIGTPAI